MNHSQPIRALSTSAFIRVICGWLPLLLWPLPVIGGEPLMRVTFSDAEQQTLTVDGKLLTEAEDGGLLMMSRDGALWTVTPEQLQRRETTAEEFAPLSAEELGRQLLAQFGDGFEIVRTRHYVICTNAGRAYGEWCGALFERLFAAFQTHWRGLELHEPEFPLPAIVFRSQGEFARYAADDIGPAVAGSSGYYSIESNRIVLFDLRAQAGDTAAHSLDEINRRVMAAPFNVATVVHEATHQIAFNSGLHTRYADNPVWLTEGMAMYFETPDLRNRQGWRSIGRINPLRNRQFQEYLRQRRPADSLVTLISTDARFRDSETAPDAYAEAWAWSYFLIKSRRAEYIAYLQHLSKKPRLVWDTPEQRLAEFKAAFSENLAELERDFVRYWRRR